MSKITIEIEEKDLDKVTIPYSLFLYDDSEYIQRATLDKFDEILHDEIPEEEDLQNIRRVLKSNHKQAFINRVYEEIIYDDDFYYALAEKIDLYATQLAKEYINKLGENI